MNFPNQIYENPPQRIENFARAMLEHGVKPEIEVFDLVMLYNARDLAREQVENYGRRAGAVAPRKT